MEDLTQFENDEKIIFEMIKYEMGNENYDYATDLFMFLNKERMAHGMKEISLYDMVLKATFENLCASKNRILEQVYIVEFYDGISKIGVSKNPTVRLRTLETQRGILIKSRLLSIPTENARKIESSLHKLFNKNRLEGEYFNADFEDICKKAVEHFSEFTSLNVPLQGGAICG